MAYLPNPNPQPITGVIASTQSGSWAVTATVTGTAQVQDASDGTAGVTAPTVGGIKAGVDPGGLLRYNQVDTSGVQQVADKLTQDFLQQMLTEIVSMRLAIVALACEGGRNNPDDFDPDYAGKDVAETT